MTGISLPDTLQNEAIYHTRLSRSEHPEPVEGASASALRQAQDASARLGEKVSGSKDRDLARKSPGDYPRLTKAPDGAICLHRLVNTGDGGLRHTWWAKPDTRVIPNTRVITEITGLDILAWLCYTQPIISDGIRGTSLFWASEYPTKKD